MKFNFFSKLLLGALVVFIFSNCGKDEFSPSGLTYKAHTNVTTGCDDPDDNIDLGTAVNGCITEPTLGLQVCSSLEFTSDSAGTIELSVFGTTENTPFTYILSGDNITITTITDGDVEIIDGTINESRMVLTSDDLDDNCQTVATYIK